MMRALASIFLLLLASVIAKAQPNLPISANNGPTTSAQLATVIKDETGSGQLVFNSGPALGKIFLNGAVNEKFVTDTIDGSGVLNVDLRAAPNHIINNTASISAINLQNPDPTPGVTNGVVLYFVSTGCTTCTQAWGGSIKMPNGVPPTLSPNTGTINPLALQSIDNGSSYMMVIGAAY